MEDGAFAFIQAVFHVVLFFVIHGRCSRHRIKTNRKQKM